MATCVRLLGPDGRAVASATTVMVDAVDRFLRGGEKPPHVDTATDNAGMITFSWASGAAGMKISVPGVGYGFTGLMDVVPGKTIDAPVPPLAPYATISGTLPASLVGPGVEFVVIAKYEDWDDRIKIPAGADGRFKVAVAAGQYWIHANKNGQRIAEIQSSMNLAPGQVAANILLTELPAGQLPPPGGTRMTKARPVEDTITWVRGTVTDEAGKPVEGASVYVAATCDGGIRDYGMASKATTDAAGHYAVKSEGAILLLSGTLVAYKRGLTPAMTWFTPPEPSMVEIPPGTTQATSRMATPPTPQRDMVLSSHGGKLDITTVQDGAPVAGASVGLWLEGGSLRDIWAAGRDEPAHKEVEAIAYPIRSAGPDGVAHFDCLPPGWYRIIATTGQGDVRSIDLWAPALSTGEPYAIAEGIAVRWPNPGAAYRYLSPV